MSKTMKDVWQTLSEIAGDVAGSEQELIDELEEIGLLADGVPTVKAKQIGLVEDDLWHAPNLKRLLFGDSGRMYYLSGALRGDKAKAMYALTNAVGGNSVTMDDDTHFSAQLSITPDELEEVISRLGSIKWFLSGYDIQEYRGCMPICWLKTESFFLDERFENRCFTARPAIDDDEDDVPFI